MANMMNDRDDVVSKAAHIIFVFLKKGLKAGKLAITKLEFEVRFR